MADLDKLSIQIEANTRGAKSQISKLAESLEALNGVIGKIDASKFQNLANATNSLSQGLSGLKGSSVKQIAKVGQALDEIKSNDNAFTNVVEGAKDLGENSEKATTDVYNILGALKSGGESTVLQSVNKQLEEFSGKALTSESSIKGLKGMLASLKIIIPTQELDKTQKKFEKIKEKAQELSEQMDFKSKTVEGYVDSKAMESDKAKLEGLINEMERLKLKQKELESHGGFRFNTQGLANFGKSLQSISKKLDNVIKKLFNFNSHTKDSKKSTDSFRISSDKLAKSLTRTAKMLRLMVVRMVLRKLIDNVTTGFGNLARASETFNASLSLLWNSFRQLGNSVAAAVSPLINALAPALNYIIQLCIKAVNVINQLISALVGKGTWTKAKGLSDSYGASLEKGAKSAKELKKTVMSFDELNQLDDNSDKGGGASATDPADMFELAEVEQKWKDLAQNILDYMNKILDPIKKAWAKVGDYVVSSWKKAFKSLGKLFKDIGDDFLEVWNQPETLAVLENILRIVGNLGNLVDALATKFDIAWKRNEVGKKILENIRDIFGIIISHIEEATRKTTVWAMQLDFYPLLEAFRGWLESIKPVVDAISQVFEDFYTDVLLKLTQWALEKGLPELLQVFIDFNEKVDWENLKTQFKDLWAHIEPFAERVGEGLILFIRDVSDALANFINSKAFQNFLDAVKNWMDNVDADDVARTLKLVAGAIITLKGALFLLEGIKGINATFDTIKTFLGFFSNASWLTNLKGTAEAVGGLSSSLAGLGATLQTFDLFKKINEDKEISKLSDDLMDGKISIEDYSEAVNEINYGTVIKDTYSLGDAFKDLFTNCISKDKVDILGSLRESLRQNHEWFDNFVTWVESWSQTTTKSFDDVQRAADSFSTQNVVEQTNSLESSSASFGKFAEEVTVMQESVSTDMAYLSSNIEGEWQTITKTTDDGSNNVKKTTDDLKSCFTADKWTLSGVWEGIEATFNNAIEIAKEIWNRLADWINEKAKIHIDPITIMGKTIFDGADFTLFELPKFRAGGFPEDGLFMANHGEMVGKFSNGKTAVANNEQITDGIAQAVYSAIISANSNSGSGQYINNTIQIDGETIARAVTKGQQSINRRYSPTMS